MQKFTLMVKEGEQGVRLDVYLAGFFQQQKLGISRAAAQKIFLAGLVSLNNKPVKAHHKIKAGEIFEVQLVEKERSELKAEEISLDVVYEDEYLAVINKPIGLVVHPAPGNYEHTMVNALLHRFKKLSRINPERPGIVHRLDKDTSGLIVIAKDDNTHLALAEKFASHDIKRQYVALVKGKMEFDESVIEFPIGRHPGDRKKMSVGFGDKTKYAKTHYLTLKRGSDVSLVQLTPFTGRTHQLRVHLAFIGHPIMGDTKYGKAFKFPRLALHAQYLGFVHPIKNNFVEFQTPIPKEFTDFIK